MQKIIIQLFQVTNTLLHLTTRQTGQYPPPSTRSFRHHCHLGGFVAGDFAVRQHPPRPATSISLGRNRAL